MPDLRFGTLTPARISGLALSFCAAGFSFCAAGFAVVLAAASPAAAAPLDDHKEALAALADVKAAVAELVQVDTTYATDRNVYKDASQRAINLLAGVHGNGYVAIPGAQTDATGGIGHIDALLDRKETPVWAAPLHGAEANMRAAVAYLQDSLKARELMDYEIASSRALIYLEVARGRPTETGVLGGLEGVFANTVLGVPAGASQADACGTPSATPAYGTHNGYLAWVSLPSSNGSHALAEAPGGTELVVRSGLIVVNTAAASMVNASCDGHAEAGARPSTAAASQSPAATSPHPPIAEAAAQQPDGAAVPTQAAPTQAAAKATAAGPPPALFTEAQAKEGAQIFSGKCVRCHGENLQGTAAPSVAGNDFLQTAQRNGWTLAMIRYLVVNNMPMNAPDSLSPTQYASVLAFLLASNCYPAGSKPFPTSAEPEFSNIKLGPVPGEHPDKNSRGVCKVD